MERGRGRDPEARQGVPEDGRVRLARRPRTALTRPRGEAVARRRGPRGRRAGRSPSCSRRRRAPRRRRGRREPGGRPGRGEKRRLSTRIGARRSSGGRVAAEAGGQDAGRSRGAAPRARARRGRGRGGPGRRRSPPAGRPRPRASGWWWPASAQEGPQPGHRVVHLREGCRRRRGELPPAGDRSARGFSTGRSIIPRCGARRASSDRSRGARHARFTRALHSRVGPRRDRRRRMGAGAGGEALRGWARGGGCRSCEGRSRMEVRLPRHTALA